MTKKGFVLYHDQHGPIKSLSQEQKGDLLDAIFEYQNNGTVPDPGTMVSVAFSFFRITFDRDSTKYLKKCERNRENIKKRWNTKDTNVYDGIRNDTKDTDRERDSDRERGSERDTENTIPPEKDPLEKFTSEVINFVKTFNGYVDGKFEKSAPDRTEKSFISDCNAIRLAMSKDKLSFDEIKDALRWAHGDDFWQDKIMSLSQIRKKGDDGTSKLKKIYAKSIKTPSAKKDKEKGFDDFNDSHIKRRMKEEGYVPQSDV